MLLKKQAAVFKTFNKISNLNKLIQLLKIFLRLRLCPAFRKSVGPKFWWTPQLINPSVKLMFIHKCCGYYGTENSSLYRILRLGGGSREHGGGTFFIGEIKNFAFFQTRKFSKNVKKSMIIL